MNIVKSLSILICAIITACGPSPDVLFVEGHWTGTAVDEENTPSDSEECGWEMLTSGFSLNFSRDGDNFKVNIAADSSDSSSKLAWALDHRDSPIEGTLTPGEIDVFFEHSFSKDEKQISVEFNGKHNRREACGDSDEMHRQLAGKYKIVVKESEQTICERNGDFTVELKIKECELCPKN